jgi:disintegrin and metalloproteinase domain-containing protein 10
MCSPSQGPCCTASCTLKYGDKCRDDNGCRDPSYCDGRMPQCPPSVNKPNKTICNEEFVCYMGVSIQKCNFCFFHLMQNSMTEKI